MQAVSPPPDGAYAAGNTAEGNSALRDLTTGQFNTAVGIFSLTLNTGGNSNTGVGASALRNNTTGDENTAIGADALRANKTGVDNTATGWQALFHNTEGDGNTANGAVGAAAPGTTPLPVLTRPSGRAQGEHYRLPQHGRWCGCAQNNTTGNLNTAVGTFALSNNEMAATTTQSVTSRSCPMSVEPSTTPMAVTRSTTNTASENNAFGDLAMENNTTGASNTAIGDDALRNYVDGSGNVAVGDEAGTGLGASVNNCIAIGAPGAGPFATLITPASSAASSVNRLATPAAKRSICRSI